jgi:hypothetical protein
MTPPPDDLRDLWNLDSGTGGRTTPEQLRDIEQKAIRFDRTIRLRDLRETAGGLIVAAIFVWFAVHDRTWLERAAHGWLAACGVWIAFYIRRYSNISRRPVPEQNLLAYQAQLLDRYDRQIRLLKTARYWYILPFWAGLVCSAAAGMARTGDVFRFGLVAICVTALNASLVWLNEAIGVAYLLTMRRQLIESTGIGGGAE